VLIYIDTKFLAPIPLISLGIDDFLFQFPPKSTNSSRRISRKSLNQLKPDLRPAKAGPPAKAFSSPAKAGPSPASQRHRSAPPRSRLAFLAPPPRSAQLLSPDVPRHQLAHLLLAPWACPAKLTAPPPRLRLASHALQRPRPCPAAASPPATHRAASYPLLLSRARSCTSSSTQ
jgi:hypothetical protein